MNPQYMDGNYPYGGPQMSYNQMPMQQNDGGNQTGYPPTHYNAPPSQAQQFSNGPPPQTAYSSQQFPQIGKGGQANPGMPMRPPLPPTNAGQSNGNSPPNSHPQQQQQQQQQSRMQGPPAPPSHYQNANMPPNQQLPGIQSSQRSLGNPNVPPQSGISPQMMNQMGSMQISSSGAPRPPMSNGTGNVFVNNAQPARLPSPPNAYGPPDQSFPPNQHGARPSGFPQQSSMLTGQQPPPPNAQQSHSLSGNQGQPLGNQHASPLGGQPPGMQQPPSLSGHQPPMGGHQPPPMGGHQPPPMGGHQPPLSGQQPSIGLQQPPAMGPPQPPPPVSGQPPRSSQPPFNRAPNDPYATNASSGGYQNAPHLPQLQDFGHRLPSSQPPLSTGGQPPSMNTQYLNSSNYSQPPSVFNQPTVNASSNMDSLNQAGNMPPYSGPPTSHQFSIGATPPPSGPGLAPQIQPQPPQSQYGNSVQHKYPPGMGVPPAGPQYMAPNHQMQPGSGPAHPSHPSPHHQQQQQQQQQQRRLDPDMMPSPIQVMEDDRKSRELDFCTNLKGQVPPLVTTKFITRDQGNSNPRFIRSTMYTVPCNPDMMKQTSIPFVLSISPFAKLGQGEIPPPIIQPNECGPTRCIRCKAYMCPYMQFIDGGRRFQCSFCRATTEVPPEYFAHLDHTGLRVDKYERPELCLGSYEFIATKDYCKNNVYPLPPAFVFIIDVSYNNIKSGVVQLLCQNMKSILAHLPRENSSEESQIKVGFITYSNSVQFYNLKSCLSQPQVLVVPDVQDMFMPLLDGFLVSLDEAGALIDNLMEQIPLMNADSRETETILGPVIKAGLEALKAADRTGKLFVFHSSLPIAEAPGKLKNRDDRKLLGTEKEKTVLAPQNPFYSQLGQECVAAGCSVDLFTFPNAYIDIATIGQVSRLSGGQIHKYTYFVAEIDGERLIQDVYTAVNGQVAFDAIMRVRTSTGIRPVEFYGNYYMSNTTDVELAAIDTDKAVCTEIKHDDKLTDEETVYIQAAILYTSVGGQRRLRVHNISLNTCTQMADLYKNCELDTLMNFYSKFCLRQLCDQTPKQVKDNLINKCAQGLACYRKNCASPSSAGQLILPECMKLLPLYVNCLMKNDAISGGSDMTTDDRSFAMHFLNSMNVSSSFAFIYPRLIPLHDLDFNSITFPNAMRCTFEKLKDNGIYLLENGLFMFMWIGMNADSNWLQNVFGVQSAAQIDIDKAVLLDLDNPISRGVRQIISEVREERRKHLKLIIIHQRDKLEVVFRHFLVEDKGIDGSPSYVDFLCHVHKEIRNLLN